jgi:hypothetical protein
MIRTGSASIVAAGVAEPVQWLVYRLIRFTEGTGRGFFVFATASRPALGPPSLSSNGYRGITPGVKRPGGEANHSLPYNPEVKNTWNYISTPLIVDGWYFCYCRSVSTLRRTSGRVGHLQLTRISKHPSKVTDGLKGSTVHFSLSPLRQERLWDPPCFLFRQYSKRFLLSPSWEANRRSASERIPRVLWNPNVHYRVHMSPSLVSIQGLLNPVHTLTPYFFKTILIWSSYLRLGLPCALFFSRFSTKVCIVVSSPLCVLHVPISFFLMWDFNFAWTKPQKTQHSRLPAGYRTGTIPSASQMH